MTDNREAGWVVLTYEHQRWAIDWDGELHTDYQRALAALQQCREGGWTAKLAKMEFDHA